MKLTSQMQITTKTVKSNESPTGPNCISDKPPSYGLDAVDHFLIIGCLNVGCLLCRR